MSFPSSSDSVLAELFPEQFGQSQANDGVYDSTTPIESPEMGPLDYSFHQSYPVPSQQMGYPAQGYGGLCNGTTTNGFAEMAAPGPSTYQSGGFPSQQMGGGPTHLLGGRPFGGLSGGTTINGGMETNAPAPSTFLDAGAPSRAEWTANDNFGVQYGPVASDAIGEMSENEDFGTWLAKRHRLGEQNQVPAQNFPAEEVSNIYDGTIPNSSREMVPDNNTRMLAANTSSRQAGSTMPPPHILPAPDSRRRLAEKAAPVPLTPMELAAKGMCQGPGKYTVKNPQGPQKRNRRVSDSSPEVKQAEGATDAPPRKRPRRSGPADQPSSSDPTTDATASGSSDSSPRKKGKGQTSGFPQALRAHKARCCPIVDCKDDCPLKAEFPEKWLEKCKKRIKNDELPVPYQVALWAHWSEHRLPPNVEARADGFYKVNE